MEFSFLLSDSLETTLDQRRKDAYGEWQFALLNQDASLGESHDLDQNTSLSHFGYLWSQAILANDGLDGDYGVGGIDEDAKGISRIQVIEGHFPEKAGEAAIEASLLNYLDVFLVITASLLGIFGWRFLSLSLLSGALYLILFFLLLFSGAAKILPSEVLPVFLLPAVLLSGHAIFLQRQKSSDSDDQDSTDHQKILSNQNTGKAYTRLLSQGLRSKVQFLSSEEADYGEKFLYHIDECSAKDLALLEKEMNRSMKDHYRLQRISNSQFYLHRIPKKNKKNQDSSD